MKTEIGAPGSNALILRKHSLPFMSGITISSSTRSGWCSPFPRCGRLNRLSQPGPVSRRPPLRLRKESPYHLLGGLPDCAQGCGIGGYHVARRREQSHERSGLIENCIKSLPVCRLILRGEFPHVREDQRQKGEQTQHDRIQQGRDDPTTPDAVGVGSACVRDFGNEREHYDE